MGSQSCLVGGSSNHPLHSAHQGNGAEGIARLVDESRSGEAVASCVGDESGESGVEAENEEKGAHDGSFGIPVV